MMDFLMIICYLAIFYGVYKLLFKNSGFGCLIIIIAVILGNIFIPDVSINNKLSEDTKVVNIAIQKKASVRSSSFYENTTESKYIDKQDDNFIIEDYGKFENDESNTNSLKNNRESELEEIVYDNEIEDVYQVRVGAVCNDGTISTATGRGACSSHGGVDYWLYE